MKTSLAENQVRPLPAKVCQGRWISLVAGTVGLLAAASVQAQTVTFPLPFYEPFPSAVSASGLAFNGFAYVNNEELGQPVNETIGGFAACSSNVWDIAVNSISSSCARVLCTNGQSGLEYPGLTNVDATYQTGLFSTFVGDSSSTKDRGVLLAIPPNNTNAPESVYLSFLLNIQTTSNTSPTQPYSMIGLCPPAGGQTGAVLYMNSSFQLQLSKNSATASTNVTAPLVVSNTYLIVVSYQYNTGTNDSVNLWVDPIGLGTSTVPPPTMTITNNANLTSNFFGGLEIFQNAVPPHYFMDEMRVATNWAQVTPTFPAPGVIYNVTGGGTNCIGESGQSTPVVGLSGSDSTVTYFLYTNGIPTGQSVNGNGSTVTFGPQSYTALFSVLGSNNVNSNVGWMAGTVQGAVLTQPSITVEPIPVLATTNGLAAFTAFSPNFGATYQWFRNGTNLVNGGNISGAQSANLVISPVGTGDALTTSHGYYLEVLSGCGTPAYSTTNSLTLQAPATDYWIGDGLTNAWDVDLSTNWASSSGGTPTQAFNFGDNVVFDDSGYATPAISLNNSYLSPSSITINGAANNFAFTGPGSLTGSGNIIMNSTATLNLNVLNTETGGIVISNGIVTFFVPADLGKGIITLAGGELASPNNGAETITNQIDVTGTNSAIGVNSTGGQNLTLSTPLVGISGTLTFVNNSGKASTPLIILPYTNNSTFNLPVDLSLGVLAGNGLVVADENTSGTHTWGGVITDAGQIERNGAGGTTLLTSSNTFTGSVLLVAGSIGVGSSSVFNPPFSVPALLSGPLGVGTLTVQAGSPTLFASGGPRMIGNLIEAQATLLINGTNNLTLGGPFDLFGTNRTLNIANTGATIMTNIIFDSVNDTADAGGLASNPVGALTKSGAGTLYLDCFETNGVLDINSSPLIFGTISNTAGTIAGSGVLAGPMVVAAGSTIGAGDAAQIGTLTISNTLTLQGTTSFRISKNVSVRTNDQIAGLSNVVYGGALVLNNTGPTALAINDTFQLFNASSPGAGNFTNISGGGADFTFNPSTGVLTVSGLIPTTPTNITVTSTVTTTGGTLNLSWPASYQGWVLQTNSINVANTNDWFNYPGSGSVTSEAIAILRTNNVYFRLVGP